MTHTVVDIGVRKALLNRSSFQRQSVSTVPQSCTEYVDAVELMARHDMIMIVCQLHASMLCCSHAPLSNSFTGNPVLQFGHFHETPFRSPTNCTTDTPASFVLTFIEPRDLYYWLSLVAGLGPDPLGEITVHSPRHPSPVKGKE